MEATATGNLRHRPQGEDMAQILPGFAELMEATAT
jgi:hypothetical protein